MSEYVQFAVAMVLFIAALICSYWFMLYPPGSGSLRQAVREREAG